MLSIVITALNEEENIVGTIEAAREAAQRAGLADYEILVADDGSTDGTTVAARSATNADGRIRCLRFNINRGPGAVFSDALEIANGSYITCIPGDNSLKAESLANLFREIGHADVVASYITNVGARPWLRRQISQAYTGLWKMTFRLPIRYINGTCVYPVDQCRQVSIASRRFAFSAELTAKLLIRGASYVEVPMEIQAASGRSTAVTWRSLKDILGTVMGLLYEVYVSRNIRHGAKLPSRKRAG